VEDLEGLMACKCAPALYKLRNEFDVAYPKRDRSSDGCCGDTAHSARKSDHNADEEGYAHALDVDEDVSPGLDLSSLWEYWTGARVGMFRKAGVPATQAGQWDERIKYLIYERCIAYPNGEIKYYSGENAHKHHMHVSIHPWATFLDENWLAGYFYWLNVPSFPKEEFDMPRDTDVVGVLPTGEPMRNGLVPHVRVRRNGAVEAVNGAFEGRAFPGSLQSVGIKRADVTGIIERPDHPRTKEGYITGYTITTEELLQDEKGNWFSPCFNFPA
jgi:hypothetical protein